MKISLNCKLDDVGAYGFIEPIADIEEVAEIRVFRDTRALAGNKIKYYTPRMCKWSLLRQIIKFFQMLFLVPSDTTISIGIYEIPHGLLAFLIGKIKKIPTVICIIGNPGYSRIRKGLRKSVMYFMLQRVEAVTVTGSKSKEILVDNGVEPQKIYILPNSFDTNRLSPWHCEKTYDIISLGYLNPEKELVNFLRIVDVVRKRFPAIKVGIAGRGPEEERLRRTIQELALGDNVELLGYVENVAEYYNSGRVGCNEMTRFGMKEGEMERIAEFMVRVFKGEEPIAVKNEVINFRKSFQEVEYCFKDGFDF